MIEESLRDMKEAIVQYGTLILSMIDKSVQGLVEKDDELLKEVMETLEPEANRKELQIDEKVLNGLALFQPEAKDLRVILMVSKMNSDLERMGDLASNIAEGASILISRAELISLNDYSSIVNNLLRMEKKTKKMLDQSITAFIDEDALLAVEVLKNDDAVDYLRDQVLREMIAFMQDPKVVERGLQVIRIVRNLERIADHATNIAEDVIFIKEGKVVKHKSAQESKEG